MNKEDKDSSFNFDMDPEFNENFYKNLDKVLSDVKADTLEAAYQEDLGRKEETGIVGGQEMINTSMMEDNQSLEGYTPKDNMETDIEDELNDISASLAKQISEELNMTEGKASQPKKKKMPRWLKAVNCTIVVMLVLIGSGLFLGLTNPGNKLLMKMGVDLTGRIWETMTGSFESEVALAEDKDYLDEEDLVSDAEEADLSQIKWPEHPGDGRQEEGVYNVLLLGEEAIGQGTSRGRTDVIIIATLNTKQKTVKLTSILRDTLVQIPGYKDNKLNSAYEKGGLELMYETIALNFDIRLDGCVMVNFENFEKIIDRLDGLDITLTSGEAKYLRNTNYISDPDNRTVQEGVNHMNGNQVLGYVRVRKRATITGNNNDYGRTDRHRIVLNAIFEKYKTKSKVELATIMLGVLPMIKTDIDNENFEILLNTFIEMGTTEIEQLRIPADGTFTDNIEVRGMDVLIPEYDENIDILHEFVFGKDSAVKDTSDN